MVTEDTFAVPLYRYRRSIEVMIGILKEAVVSLHQEAATLSGRQGKELREIADDFDDYAQGLKELLKSKGILLPPRK